jgi:toxin-antitoxin system PIN domain toxin
MSFALDVNILLYASDTGSDPHGRAAAFLESVAEGDETCYLAWITVMSYLRIATHPGIFNVPLSPADAMGNVDRLLACPHVCCISEMEGFWPLYLTLAGETPVRGNLVPDAHLAAILKQHGIRTLYTRDRDFAKFSFLRVIDPLASVTCARGAKGAAGG